MEEYTNQYDLLTNISLALFTIILILMLSLYRSIHGKTYKIIWFVLCSVLFIFNIMVYQTYKQFSVDNFSEIKINFLVMMILAATFLFIFIYISYKISIALKKSNITKQHLDKIMESMSSYMIVTDSDFNIQKINQTLSTELGLSEDQVIGTKLESIIQQFDAKELVQTYSKQTEAFMVSHDKQIQPILIAGDPIHKHTGAINGYVFTGFKNYQKEIETMYSYFRSIFDNSEFAIVTMDLDNNITGANKAAEGYFGLTEKEMIKSAKPEQFHYKESIEEFKKLHNINQSTNDLKVLKEQVQNGKIVNEEMLMCRNNGATFPALVTFNAINNNGEVIGYFELIADITDKKQVEKNLKKANKDLKDFAHIVSHDLKAPLRAISSLASWLQDDYADTIDNNGKEQLQLMIDRTSRMENLINGILAYSRVENKQQEQKLEDLNDIVLDVSDTIVPKDKFSITVENKLPSLKINRTRALQIFQNIISNSVKHMDKEHGEIQIQALQGKGYWKFSIQDNGPGIEEQYFEKIFQIFQTLKPRDEYESTGVGLAIVKKSVELYGGKVWLESERNVGTTFFFTLPEN